MFTVITVFYLLFVMGVTLFHRSLAKAYRTPRPLTRYA